MKHLYLSRCTIIFSLLLSVSFTAKAQKWTQGCYYDLQGAKHPGLIKIDNVSEDNWSILGARKRKISTFKFKINSDAETNILEATAVKSVVAKADSFVVNLSINDKKGKPDTTALFYTVDLRTLSVNIYSHGYHTVNGTDNYIDIEYYYGTTIDDIKDITKDNFIEVMCKALNGSPDLVEKIKSKDYKLGKIEKLINAYKTEKGIAISTN